ncbi:DUF2300 domain-containing protein [Neisseria sp. Ec49-e6-T10]|uniref:DUF2300 domain-containing protein n=1 Tax=Neisseria sp. Ec49-e6-T10 TaxID=3140744 RepID=UPI003EBDB3AE
MRYLTWGVILLLVKPVLANNNAVLYPSKQYSLGAISNGSQTQSWQISTQKPFHTQSISPEKLHTPLGSVWKLFVYGYLVDNKINAPDYVCKGKNPEEKYCCQKGQSIGQEQALQQSCGLFFDPKRLNISNTAWRHYWQKQQAPKWLQELNFITENHYVPVTDLLNALSAIPNSSKVHINTTLLPLMLRKSNQQTLAVLGSELRVKTFTMPYPNRPQERIGGFAGFLADGRAIWFAGRGRSVDVMAKAGTMLAPIVQSTQAKNDLTCVEVDYFDFLNNPITTVTDKTGKTIHGGVLKGTYQVSFAKGNKVRIVAQNDLLIQKNSLGKIKLIGKMSLNEYVARVIDREAAAKPTQAARALAIAARSYLLQEATGAQDCLLISDSTQKQRVAPSSASKQAKIIAAQTDRLVLTGSTIHYQLDTNRRNQLSWKKAVEQDQKGLSFEAILAHAYPQAKLNIMNSKAQYQCKALPQASQWLNKQSKIWLKTLRTEPGFQMLTQMPSLCQISRGTPYTDVSANRIYIRQFKTQNDQITLAHEYLHLIFAQHPNGQNEQFIENLARQLILRPLS